MYLTGKTIQLSETVGLETLQGLPNNGLRIQFHFNRRPSIKFIKPVKIQIIQTVRNCLISKVSQKKFS